MKRRERGEVRARIARLECEMQDANERDLRAVREGDYAGAQRMVLRRAGIRREISALQAMLQKDQRLAEYRRAYRALKRSWGAMNPG